MGEVVVGEEESKVMRSFGGEGFEKGEEESAVGVVGGCVG